MSQHEIDVHADVTLNVDTFGDRDDPPIVLVPAPVAASEPGHAGDPGDPAMAWTDAVCERLAAGLRFVVRYGDRGAQTANRGAQTANRGAQTANRGAQTANRGAQSGGHGAQSANRGSSDMHDAGCAGPIDLSSRIDDLVALLDALELGRVHLAAGADAATIAQAVADRHADRVASVIVVAHPREPLATGVSVVDPLVETAVPTYVVAGADDALVTTILRHTSGGWQRQADRLADRALDLDDPTAWFDRLYRAASAGEVDMPWDSDEPNPLLVGWARSHAQERARDRTSDLAGPRALVVGTGLGRDAEFVASLGFRTTAFDVSPTAIANARERYPQSAVDYHVANLLDPPAKWTRAFDLVVEIYTIQAMPRSVRDQAIANVAGFIAAGGTLLVIQAYAEAPDEHGPPWPPTRDEIDAIAGGGLNAIRVEVVDSPSGRRWRAEFVRPV
jgi:pimeloyl-ACP methyl ester carboxylesterase